MLLKRIINTNQTPSARQKIVGLIFFMEEVFSRKKIQSEWRCFPFLKSFPFSFFPFLIILVISSFAVVAAPKYEFNKTCQLAYYKMLSLHFEEGKKLLEQEKQKNPDNLIPYFVENYADFFTIAINEEKPEFTRLSPGRNFRLNKLQQGPENSPWYLYTQAEVNLQWAFCNLKFENYYTAFIQIRKAYTQLQENQKKFPAFIANKKSLGLLHALIGTIPDSYKWGARTLGFSGTVTQGMKELKEVMDYSQTTPFLFYDETRYICIFLEMNIHNDVSAAWALTRQKGFPDAKTDPLACFVVADVAMKNSHTDKAIEIISSAQFSDDAMHFIYLDYLLGLCKMNRLDKDANVPMERFISDFRGQNYLKDAYQKLAWFYYLKDDESRYRYYISFCKTTGAAFTDSDKQAMKEANEGVAPNPLLLKVRLLQDGGYYQQAMLLLKGKSPEDFLSVKDKIEFSYRMGRIYHEWGKPDDAIHYYENTIKYGEKYPYYYAANAALQLGFIYEEKGERGKAIVYYRKCIAMKNTDYKNSLDQKAKAGLNRLGS